MLGGCRVNYLDLGSQPRLAVSSTLLLLPSPLPLPLFCHLAAAIFLATLALISTFALTAGFATATARLFSLTALSFISFFVLASFSIGHFHPL
jgi:hypothetical protein